MSSEEIVGGGGNSSPASSGNPFFEPEPGTTRGRRGTTAPVVRLYDAYPSHTLPERSHLEHCGLSSSHLTLRILSEKSEISKGAKRVPRNNSYLQLLHPVLTLGRLALLDLLGFEP